MRFVFAEGCMEVPDGTRDDSVQVLTIPCGRDLPLVVTLRRSARPAGQPLTALVDAALADLGTRQPAFAVAWRRPYHVDGCEAVIVAAAYGNDAGAVSQRLVYIGRRAALLVLAGSVSGAFTPAHLDLLNGLAGSLRFTEPGDPTGGGIDHE